MFSKMSLINQLLYCPKIWGTLNSKSNKLKELYRLLQKVQMCKVTLKISSNIWGISYYILVYTDVQLEWVTFITRQIYQWDAIFINLLYQWIGLILNITKWSPVVNILSC
jgi:hypothetical protein